jgi:type I restriction enzyme S subunit
LSPNESFDLYSIPAHDAGTFEHLRGREIGSTKKLLAPGTVVLSKINPRIARVGVVGQGRGFRQLGSSEWIAFSPVDGIDPFFLAFTLRQESVRAHLASNVSGVGGSLMRTNAAIVEALPFQFPPTLEQRRIVEEIDSYLSRLDAAVANLERARSKLKAYHSSVLKAAVEGRLVPTEAELARTEERDYEPAEVLLERILAERRRCWEENQLAKFKAAGIAPQNAEWKANYREPATPNTALLGELPEGWCWASLEQLLVLLRNGQSKPPREDRGVRTLRISAVRPMSVNFDDVRYLPGISRDYEGDLISVDDLLFTRYNGTRALVGVCARVRHVSEPTVHPDKLIKVRLCSGPLASYIELAANTGESRRHIDSRSRTTAGQSGISGGDLKQMPVPLPPISEQQRIAEAVEDFLSVAHAISHDLEREIHRCARLRQALLKWAFEGRLADQDPNDEPAGDLLARIRVERANLSTQRRKSSRRAAQGQAAGG